MFNAYKRIKIKRSCKQAKAPLKLYDKHCRNNFASENNYNKVLRMDIGYMRVSSEGERQTTDLQKDALVKVGVDTRNIFEDKASGARDNRPGLEKALAFLQPGDCLVVWKLDRLGRSISHLLNIINDLNKRGIAFRSITDHIDTTTASGELLFNISASLAQHERNLIKERVMAGLAAAKKRGRIGGRPRLIDQEKLETILESLKAGASKASICRTYSIKRSTLYDALNRQTISTQDIF
jgi:DNA invertase Pin-like site-specific DNA recombinase